MIRKDIRLSGEDRRILFNIKNTIGIEHFYTTCRWAFCLSLDSDIDLKRLDGTSDGAVEISGIGLVAIMLICITCSC